MRRTRYLTRTPRILPKFLPVFPQSNLARACCLLLLALASCQPTADELDEPASAKRAEDFARSAAYYRGFSHVDSLFALAELVVPTEDEAFVTQAESLIRDELLGVEIAPRTDWLGKSGCLGFSGCTFDDNPKSTVFRTDPAGKSTRGSTYRIACAKNSPDDEDCDNFVIFPVPAGRVDGYYSESTTLNSALNFQAGDGAINLQELTDSTCAMVLGSKTLLGLRAAGEESPGLTIEQELRVALK